jgi:DNA polymerase Ligase (LigD)
MPRFVVLEHDHPVLHWDMMLEADGALQTWRLAQPPLPSSAAIEATRLPDHRMMYLDYEGPVSANRGTVKRWDTGTFEFDENSTPTANILHMNGTRLHGLIRLESIDTAKWLLTTDH